MAQLENDAVQRKDVETKNYKYYELITKYKETLSLFLQNFHIEPKSTQVSLNLLPFSYMNSIALFSNSFLFLQQISRDNLSLVFLFLLF